MPYRIIGIRILLWESLMKGRSMAFLKIAMLLVGVTCTATWAQEKGADPKPSGTEKAPSVIKSELVGSNWEKLMASLPDHQGKVVVIDLWSTSCDPCLKEFPELLALQERWKKEIVCISFNCDYIGAKTKPVDYYRPRVEEFLQSQKSNILNLLCHQPADELFEKLRLDSIPAVYVFDQKGKLIKRFDGQYLPTSAPASGGQPQEDEDVKFTYQNDVGPLVESLLQKP